MKRFEKLTKYHESNDLVVYINKKVKSFVDKKECYETLTNSRVNTLKYTIKYGIVIEK